MLKSVARFPNGNRATLGKVAAKNCERRAELMLKRVAGFPNGNPATLLRSWREAPAIPVYRSPVTDD